jgi:POT family proton-dependent oligopeptide transporter
MIDKSLQQPRALYMLFFAEMWERFSFYGMRALLTLYMTLQLFQDLMDPAKKNKAIGIYAAYGALVYATPFIGGIIADKLLGYKKSVTLGALLMAIGHFVMAIETEMFLYIALSFLIIGNGFFKPNISSMVGGLYHENDSRRDGGFTIFYMGINLGAFLAPLICGYIGETYGWFYGFSIAGFGMLLGLLVFGRGQHKLGENGDPPDLERLKKPIIAGLSAEYITYIGAFLAVGAFAVLVSKYELMSYVLLPFTSAVLLYILYTAIRSEKVERERLFVVVILLFFTTLFWAFFEQAGSSLTLFTNENVDRNIMGWEAKASLFQAVNPFFIILLAPFFARMWITMANRKIEPSTPVKFALGLMQLGAGFLVLVWGLNFVSINEISMMKGEGAVTMMAATVPLIFMIGAYFLHTTGELCLSPVGLSMVTKLAPKRIGAMVMGAWFLSSTMAHHVGGIIAQLTSGGGADTANKAVGTLAMEAGLIENLSTHPTEVMASFDQLANYTTVFGPLGYIALGAGVFLLLLVPLIRKWMHGVH